jgi:hypothetical protein
MPADARLALSEDLGQVLDVQLDIREQREDAKPRGLPGSAECLKALDSREARRCKASVLAI